MPRCGGITQEPADVESAITPEALEALRPLASDALLAMFQITMGEETEKAAEQTLRNAGKSSRRGRKRR